MKRKKTSSPLSFIHDVLIKLHRLRAVVHPIRILILLWVLVAIAFLIVPQAQDELRQLAEPISIAFFWFQAATVYFAFVVWQWTTVLLATQFPRQARSSQNNLATWLPRLLGLLTFLALGLAAWRAGYFPNRIYERPDRIRWMLLFFALDAVAFGFYVWGRPAVQQKTLNPQAPFRAYTHLRQRETGTKIALSVHTIVAVAFFVAMIGWPAEVGQMLRAPAILLLAGALWMTATSWAVYVGMRYRVPLLATIVVILIFASLFGDPHVITTCASLPPRDNVLTHFTSWLQKLKVRYPEPKPTVYLVATEGGGIRAAYWTAQVLTTIQRRRPDFADHCFAISAVSGGGLGAAVFDALIAMRYPNDRLPAAAHRVLSYNFLGPPLGVLLTSEQVQQVAPGIPDRAHALEEAWATGWRKAMHDEEQFQASEDLFDSPFQSLWTGERQWRVPSLLINGTAVESGQRVITSNLDIDASAANDSHVFVNARDALAALNGDLSVSRAVHMGARFTYVSPPGTVPMKDGESFHVVDGGYFDNSGAIAVREIANVIRRNFPDVNVQLMVIKYGMEEPVRFQPTFNEVFSPIRTILTTRNARSAQSVGELEVSDPTIKTFSLCGEEYPPPLGWSLSPTVQADIDRYLSPDYEVGKTLKRPKSPRALRLFNRALDRCKSEHAAAVEWIFNSHPKPIPDRPLSNTVRCERCPTSRLSAAIVFVPMALVGISILFAYKFRAKSPVVTTREGAKFGIETLSVWTKWMAAIDTGSIAALAYVFKEMPPLTPGDLRQVFVVSTFVCFGAALFCVAWIFSSLSSLALRIYTPQSKKVSGRYDIHERTLFARYGPKLTIVVTTHHFLWAFGLLSFAFVATGLLNPH